MHRFARLRRQQEGFTLIELLVVVAIIAMLATLMLPKVFEAINTAKRDATKGELATISGALARYYLENGKFPNNLKLLKAEKYVRASTTFKNKFDHFYLYAVNNAKNPSAFVLVDPGTKPQAVANQWLCSAKDNTSMAPEGVDPFAADAEEKVLWWQSRAEVVNGTGQTVADPSLPIQQQLYLRVDSACAVNVVETSVPALSTYDSLAGWGTNRKDLFTE